MGTSERDDPVRWAALYVLLAVLALSMLTRAALGDELRVRGCPAGCQADQGCWPEIGDPYWLLMKPENVVSIGEYDWDAHIAPRPQFFFRWCGYLGGSVPMGCVDTPREEWNWTDPKTGVSHHVVRVAHCIPPLRHWDAPQGVQFEVRVSACDANPAIVPQCSAETKIGLTGWPRVWVAP